MFGKCMIEMVESLSCFCCLLLLLLLLLLLDNCCSLLIKYKPIHMLIYHVFRYPKMFLNCAIHVS